MKKTAIFPVIALLGGAAALALRLMQNRTGFEPDTGLAITGNPYAVSLAVLLAALALALFVLGLSLPREKDRPTGTLAECFPCDSAAGLTVPVIGVFLWIACAAAEIYVAFTDLRGATGMTDGMFTGQDAVPPLYNAILGSTRIVPAVVLVQGAFTAMAALCMLAVLSGCRRGGTVSGNLMLAPVLCLVVRLVLAYRVKSVNPALSAYYVELLALVFLVLMLYGVASFAFNAGRTRRFLSYAALAFVLAAATLADGHSLSGTAFYAGGAALSMGLLRFRCHALAAPPQNDPA